MFEKRLAYLIPTLFWTGLLQAQQPTAPVYTSPGSPLIVNHRITTPYNSSSNRLPLVILPRFWRNSDSLTKAEDAAKFARLLAGRTRFHRVISPQTINDANIRAQLITRVIVNKDGTLQTPEVVKKQFSLQETDYSPDMLRALEREAIRAVSTLRFAAASSPDTIFIPLSFSLQ